MPHNDYAFRDEHGQPAGGTVPEPSILRELDLAASQGIDGDNGGTWAPATPIIIGGAGLTLTTNALLSGGVTTGPNAAPRAIVTSQDLLAAYLAGGGTRSRTVRFPLRDFGARFDETTIYQSGVVAYDEGTLPGAVIASNSNGTLWSMTATTVRIIAPIPHYRATVGDGAGGQYIPSLRIRVGTGSLGAPSSLAGMPGFRLTRFGATGAWVSTYDTVIPTWGAAIAYQVGDLVIPAAPNSRQFRCTVAGTSGGAQPAGFPAAVVGTTISGDGGVSWMTELGPAGATGHYITLPLPATGTAFYAQGQFQDITVPGNILRAGSPSQSFWNTPTMAGGFAVLDIIDKSGANNSFHSLQMIFTSANLQTVL